ncbi:DUF2066 domain-containing protein [Taklimakanibacter lacteus]|uniref:DUF2066 domain-containing protein n=1 Tax=Taklimakanibacter lacteus TaxID=2268456 RepID=UPI0013C47087
MRPVYVLLLVLVANGIAWAAGAESDLYRGRTLVTGIRDEIRIPAVPGLLLDVLAKVSGDARLLRDPRAAELAAGGTLLVTEYSFRDRLAGRQIHDEQGTRDRPYYLTITFDPHMVDAALERLGSKPWAGKRPRLALFLVVDNASNVYALASDGTFGRDQRDSLVAASWQTGMPVMLPSEADFAREGLIANTLSSAGPEKLGRLAKTVGADLALTGKLVWNKGTLGWAAEWRLFDGKAAHGWTIKDVNFDDAFRDALRGSALILSGNGKS